MPADTNPDAVKSLSDDEVAEIEARANAATPRYCVDWEKGRHALLQDRGWRSASEEQPRTIATFDRDNGYLDLLFCAEARTDIPALCTTVRALRTRYNAEDKDHRLTIDTFRQQERICAGRCSRLPAHQTSVATSSWPNTRIIAIITTYHYKRGLT